MKQNNTEILTPDFIDQLFEGRNKSYGAYKLRRNYNTHVAISLSVSLGLFLAVVLYPYIRDWIMPDPGLPDMTPIVTVRDLSSPPELLLQEAPDISSAKAPSENVIPTIVDSTVKVVEQKPIIPIVPDNTNANNIDSAGKGDGSGPGTGPSGEFTVSKVPEFPGGKDAMDAFFTKNLKYPEADKVAGIEGIIIVSVLINKDGSISEAKISKGLSPALNSEALRVVNLMPRWSPAIRNGKPIPSYTKLRIGFSLQMQQ